MNTGGGKRPVRSAARPVDQRAAVEQGRRRIAADVEPARGFGLQSMRRQAHALGGRLRVRSDRGAGTTVEGLLA